MSASMTRRMPLLRFIRRSGRRARISRMTLATWPCPAKTPISSTRAIASTTLSTLFQLLLRYALFPSTRPFAITLATNSRANTAVKTVDHIARVSTSITSPSSEYPFAGGVTMRMMQLPTMLSRTITSSSLLLSMTVKSLLTKFSLVNRNRLLSGSSPPCNALLVSVPWAFCHDATALAAKVSTFGMLAVPLAVMGVGWVGVSIGALVARAWMSPASACGLAFAMERWFGEGESWRAGSSSIRDGPREATRSIDDGIGLISSSMLMMLSLDTLAASHDTEDDGASSDALLRLLATTAVLALSPARAMFLAMLFTPFADFTLTACIFCTAWTFFHSAL
mmetsp:Transcript_47462/g.115338  ORF Transcript_47462/g.115338 Transcript_47462/m.115338 type:complete len:337 (+) Transcript_47462:758-1768(+)